MEGTGERLFVIEPFDPERHNRKGFRCGVVPVDNFSQRQTMGNQPDHGKRDAREALKAETETETWAQANDHTLEVAYAARRAQRQGSTKK